MANNREKREVLRGWFAANQIPTGEQFASLIDSQLNFTDDRLVPADDKLPLGLIGAPDGSVLRLYRSLESTGGAPQWSIKLDDRGNLALKPPEGTKAGLSVSRIVFGTYEVREAQYKLTGSTTPLTGLFLFDKDGKPAGRIQLDTNCTPIG